MILSEYSKAIYKSNIPQEYQHLKFIGQGATSMILDYDATHVIMLTRDKMKKDWLCNELEIADWIKTYDQDIDVSVAYHKRHKVQEMPVYVLKVDKLFPLDSKNKTLARKALSYYDKVVAKFTKRGVTDYSKVSSFLEDMEDKYGIHGKMKQLFDFYCNYNPEQYTHDLALRNMMQTIKGDLVLSDPVADRELIYYLSYR